MKPSFGECTGYKTMWYYDPNWVMNMDGQDHYLIGGCRQFNYSGCGGNSNRFPTQAACELTCQFNTKVELQINIDPVEQLGNVTTQSEPNRNNDNNQPTIVITESNKTIHNNLVKNMIKLTLMNIGRCLSVYTFNNVTFQMIIHLSVCSALSLDGHRL